MEHLRQLAARRLKLSGIPGTGNRRVNARWSGLVVRRTSRLLAFTFEHIDEDLDLHEELIVGNDFL